MSEHAKAENGLFDKLDTLLFHLKFSTETRSTISRKLIESGAWYLSSYDELRVFHTSEAPRTHHRMLLARCQSITDPTVSVVDRQPVIPEPIDPEAPKEGTYLLLRQRSGIWVGIYLSDKVLSTLPLKSSIRITQWGDIDFVPPVKEGVLS